MGITGCGWHLFINRLINGSLAIVTWLRLSEPGDSGRTSLASQATIHSPCRPTLPRASVAALLVVGKPEFLQNTAMIMMIKNLDSFGLEGR